MSELTDLLARIRSDAGNSSSGVYNTFEMDKALDLARQQQAAIDALSDWAGRNRTGSYDEAQDDVVQIIRESLEASR